jgi:hypothetical protein
MLWLAWGGLEIREILGITGLWRIRGQRFAVGPSRVCVFIASTPLGWAMFSRPSRVLSVFAGDCGFKSWKLCLFAVLFLRILANEPCFLFCFGLSGLIFPGDSRAYGLTDLCVETRGTRLSGCLACRRAIFLFWSSVGYSVARRGVTTRSSVVVWFF